MAEQIDEFQWEPLTEIVSMESVINELEEAFINTETYHLFQFVTRTGAEVGSFIFKHNNEEPAYGLLISRNIGVIIIHRNSVGEWKYKKILGL